MRNRPFAAASLAAATLSALAFSAPAAMAQQPPSQLSEDVMPANASTCLSCHGTGARPALSDVPVIAGQQPLYLRNALIAYSTGRRTGGQALVMQEIVKTLSADDIDALAEWFGGQ